MKKLIKVMNNGVAEYKEVTEDDILVIFDGMYNEFAHKCCKDLIGYKESVDNFDDYKQIAMVKAVTIFEKYDLSKNACFSKALFEGFKNLFIDIMREKEAIKRKVEQPLVYLNAESESGEEISNVIADEKAGDIVIDEANKLERFLLANLTKEDIIFYTIDLKKQLGKASTIHKSCLSHTIDIFTQAVGEFPDKKEDLAIILGLSRPTLNKRIKVACDRVRALAEEFCLCNMELAEIPF